MNFVQSFRANYLRARLRDYESRHLQHTAAYGRVMKALLDAEWRIAAHRGSPPVRRAG